MTTVAAPRPRVAVVVLLPFAAGFYLSYLFRTLNAVIGDDLSRELALGPSELGLLTSAYFFAMAAAQLPIGVLLDRYGPRLVQSVCLVIAAAGAGLFAVSHGIVGLIVGRALIGLGVGAALMSGFKAIVLWFPRDRHATMNGWLLMFGALGAVTATAPAEAIVVQLGWRNMVIALATLTLALAAIMMLTVPEPAQTGAVQPRAPSSLRRIIADPRFQRLAPLSALTIGTAWALHTLWAASWLTHVDGLQRMDVVRHLLVMALALGIGGLWLGWAADHWRRRGGAPEVLLVGIAVLSILAQLALIFELPVPPYVSWSVVAVTGAATVLSYSILGGYFPKEISGQANGALNLLHVGAAFAVQAAIGLIVDRWPSTSREEAIEGYRAALSMMAIAQLAALAWFAVWSAALRPAVLSATPTSRSRSAAGVSVKPPQSPYERAQLVYARRVDTARQQAVAWRWAAIGSAGLCAVLAFEVAAYASSRAAVIYVIELPDTDAQQVISAIADRY